MQESRPPPSAAAEIAPSTAPGVPSSRSIIQTGTRAAANTQLADAVRKSLGGSATAPAKPARTVSGDGSPFSKASAAERTGSIMGFWVKGQASPESTQTRTTAQPSSAHWAVDRVSTITR